MRLPSGPFAHHRSPHHQSMALEYRSETLRGAQDSEPGWIRACSTNASTSVVFNLITRPIR